ncbi:hypothetical protein H8356DRAFT_1350031 [Neocallimastix lanati (nom. inval.)]|nr:hypothetical protein H8356DRAFT_1350031 [Neocallimastix sp. JGI-2020a]
MGLNDTQVVSNSSEMARTTPIVGSAFPRESRRVLLYGRRRRTGMAVNHTPILLYGEDQSLQQRTSPPKIIRFMLKGNSYSGLGFKLII